MEDRTVDIKFSDLTYRSKDKKIILNSVSGIFNAGELNAIMGPSGAGKSSLMNILTGFIKSDVEGKIEFGKTLKCRKVCCYILQDDNFFPWFTIEEAMILATTLKISNKSMSFKEKQNLISNILETLHLTQSKNTKCANLSGGQKKRLSIALELVDNPPVIFLDEPTTGLDSSSSMDLVRLLKQLCSDGRTIVCTIHQPSASIYQMFGHIYMLDKGFCIYQGSPLNTVPFLESIGLKCPPYHNPADFMMEVITGQHGCYSKEMIENSQDCKWRLEILPNDYNSGHKNEHKNVKQPKWVSKQTTNHIYPPPEWIRLWLLIGRCNIQFYRDWTVTHLKLILHIICSILVGLLFGDSGTNATKSISNVGLFLIAVVYLWYTTSMPGVLKFPSEISILKRESFNNWYKIRTYYLATIITSTPVNIIFATTFSSILYFLTDQPFEVGRYFKFCLVNILLTIAADGFGILLGTIYNPVNGTFIGAIMSCFMLIFSGFLILFEHMSIFMRGISFASPHRYALESLILSVYNDNRTDMICPSDTMYCHFKNPNMLLKNLGMFEGIYSFNVLMLFLQIIVFRSLAYCTLKRAIGLSN